MKKKKKTYFVSRNEFRSRFLEKRKRGKKGLKYRTIHDLITENFNKIEYRSNDSS